MSLILSGSDGVSDIDGTAATPAIRGTDANTGIFFSAADTIDFTEGGTACGQFDSSANFKFNSGYGSVATAYGCRVWINYNASGTPAIRGSGNVTSITDHGIGEQTVNFTNALPDTNYAVVSLNSTPGGDRGDATQVNTYATTSVRLEFVDRGGNYYDPTVVALVVFR